MIASVRLLPLILAFFSISCLGYDRITGHPLQVAQKLLQRTAWQQQANH